MLYLYQSQPKRNPFLRSTIKLMIALIPSPVISCKPSAQRMGKQEEERRFSAVTPSEISPAAESIANNVDLLTEILLRLPATHTIRFKIVSKHWLSLLSDSHFAADHSIRNPIPSISAFYFNSEGTPVPVSLHGGRLSIPSLSSFLYGIGEPSRTTVVHSFNGLLLCCDSHFPVSCYGKGRQYIICNPTTKQYTILPISHPFESYKRRLYTAAYWHAYLALDPSRSPH